MNKYSLSGNEVAVTQYKISTAIYMVYISGSKICSNKFHWFDK